MSQPLIIAHRGLQPSTPNFYAESSYEAFRSQIEAGFCIEFDFNLTKDKQIVILHDQSLTRISQGKDKRVIGEIDSADLRDYSLGRGRVCFFTDLMPLLSKASAPLHAFHIKGDFQDLATLDILLANLKKWPALQEKLLLFDIKIDSAKYLKEKIPQLHLAPSVAHPFDIKRFNSVVKNTLLTVAEAIKAKNVFDWVWLDEWDLSDETGYKQLYTSENFTVLHQHGFKIGLVTPELHATSPGLLGGEAHPDAKTNTRLFQRIQEIIALQPEAMCTNYPFEVLQLL